MSRVECVDEGVGVEGLVASNALDRQIQQRLRASQIVRLAGREHHVDGVAERIDQGVDFGGEPAARAADRLFAFFSCAGAVLVSAHDGGVEHHVFVIMVARSRLKKRSKTPLFDD